jgi:hypothetical protein
LLGNRIGTSRLTQLDLVPRFGLRLCGSLGHRNEKNGFTPLGSRKISQSFGS